MGELFRLGGVIIRIWSKDHNPPHLEAYWPSMRNWEAKEKFQISDLECIENSGFSVRDLKLIRKFLETRRERLSEKWREIHGQD